MAGNLFSLILHPTFEQKIRNFPDSIYDFNPEDNLTKLMKILLGNSGTGQLSNLQTIARLGQQYLEFSNLDTVMGLILDVQRQSSEIYSFATNPFIDQLDFDKWKEVTTKDTSYRERLLLAAEAFQLGSTVWGVMTMCEAITGVKFQVVESWKTPGYGRPNLSSNSTEVVLIPILDDSGLFTWDQGKANSLVQSVTRLLPTNFVISIGSPVTKLNSIDTAYVPASYSEHYYLTKEVTASQLSAPGVIAPGSETRYWLQNNSTQTAPTFAHLQTQETTLDLTGNIVSTTVSAANNVTPDLDLASSGDPGNSIALTSVSITSTVYGNQ